MLGYVIKQRRRQAILAPAPHQKASYRQALGEAPGVAYSIMSYSYCEDFLDFQANSVKSYPDSADLKPACGRSINAAKAVGRSPPPLA